MAKKPNTLTLRDKRQQEFAQVWLNNGKFGILNLCPRFGKIYTTINILEKLDKDINPPEFPLLIINFGFLLKKVFILRFYFAPTRKNG